MAGKRTALLDQAWADEGVYLDPTGRAEGRDALAAHIAGFQSMMPGHTIDMTSGVDAHDGAFRFAWVMRNADGVALEGMDYGELRATTAASPASSGSSARSPSPPPDRRPSMPLTHLPATTNGEAVSEALSRDGAVIIDHLAPDELLDRVADELAPNFAATPTGPDDFSGRNTRRTGALIARSPASRELVMHPLILAAAGHFLGHATNFQLHLTQLIAIGPDQPAQLVHRDQWAFDFFPFPTGYEVQCNTIWAADRLHRGQRRHPGRARQPLADDKQRLDLKPTPSRPRCTGLGAALRRVVYHGGGANTPDATRVGVNITYSVAWLRQEENQYLSVPPEVAASCPIDLQRLLGLRPWRLRARLRRRPARPARRRAPRWASRLRQHHRRRGGGRRLRRGRLRAATS